MEFDHCHSRAHFFDRVSVVTSVESLESGVYRPAQQLLAEIVVVVRVGEYRGAHSLAYFEPKPQTEADGSPRKIDFTDKDGVILSSRVLADADGNPIQMSDFDVDMMVLDANERVSAELRLLEFHTPKMKAVEVDMDVHGSVVTIEDRLRELCGETDEEED